MAPSSSKAPCRFFPRPGGCRKGKSCTFSHDIKDSNSQEERPLCEHFLMGRCRYGKECKFSHDLGENEDKNSEAIAHASIQSDLRSWRYQIPLNPATARPLGPKLTQFFNQGLHLVSCEPAIMQEVITSLSSEGGLTRIKELLELRIENLSEESQAAIFSSDFLPFFRTIIHPRVLASNVLEKHVGTIYNFVYGHGGHRTLNLYRPVTNMLMHFIDHDSSDPVGAKTPLDLAACLEATVLVLAKIIDFNGTASLNDEFVPIVEVLPVVLNYIEELDHGLLLIQRTRQHLSRIQQRLGLGQSMPAAETIKSKPNALPSFQIEVDGPGWLSKDGARHDNDHDDISQISILPTSDEIRAYRREYLPVNDPERLHLGGIEGLLDRHFRLLREDTVGQLRDAIRLEIDNKYDTKGARQVVRTHSYQNVQCVTMEFDQWKGLRFLVSFDQPNALQKLHNPTDPERRRWWESSKRLQAESLVCILSTDGRATFCTVVGTFELKNDPASEEEDDRTDGPRSSRQASTGLHSHQLEGTVGKIDTSIDFYGHKHRAHTVLRLVQHDEWNIQQMLGQFTIDDARGQSSLIEFPGVLLPAFQPTLQALQHMSKASDIPFANRLAPTSGQETDSNSISPPLYAMDRRFRFDLSCLLQDNKDLTLSLRDQFDLDYFRRNTTLDNAQASAVVDALTRDIALIQGPPGTGKSFTGVALIKVLLENATNGDIGPIICVCYTNHALDQLLEQLLNNGVTQIIRIGSRSKSELLEPLNLRKVMEQMVQTPQEKKAKYELGSKLSEDTEAISDLLEQLGRISSPSTIENYLLVHYPEQHSQLFGDEDEDGFRRVYRKDNVIHDWLKARYPQQLNSNTTTLRSSGRSIDLLSSSYVHSMTYEERRRLYGHWMTEIARLLQEQFVAALLSYHMTKEEHDHIKDDLKLRCLEQANIIGLTTSGLARNITLLRKLRSKVLLCEEAGEVLEAHLLTAMLPSIEHAILIGDPEQLRPQIQNYNLSRENFEGRMYSLDVSLFERLINPQEPSFGLPYSVLETQRRMHPSISRLIRKTLYPMLKDAPTVEGYPEVTGMRKRLYWLDHTHFEVGKDESSTTSYSNDFEIEMVGALVSHLVRQSVYKAKDIAILTPYLGQLHRLRQDLASRFEIVVSERDIQNLEAAGLEALLPTPSPETSRTTLLNALRIATVDNFQGEEAKIVVISLVRSNPQNQCGFLKTSNRINVLLSRAQHGMYIIGNSQTYSGVKMWKNVLQLLQAGGNAGPSLELQCARHSETIMNVSGPDDFLRFAPEGGCTEMCAHRLPCGHKCITKCHSEALHNAVVCLEPCTRSKKGCDHPCPKPCGEPCEKKCMVELDNLKVTLSCGHSVNNLPCWQAQDKSTVVCKEQVRKIAPGCNHEIVVNCCTDVTRYAFKCYAPCQSVLSCGHVCQKRCSHCRKRKDGGSVEVDHGICQAICGRNYSTCNHHCSELCHEGDCPPCGKPCELRCTHSQCAKLCSEPCAPCAESSCSSQCPHTACTMPCAAPCDWIPCSMRCEKILSCGHQCPSLCGEECPEPTYCQICASNEIRDTVVDYTELETYKNTDLDKDPIIFPQCGHLITLSSMDGQMDMSRHYTMNNDGLVTGLNGDSEPLSEDDQSVKSCPQCRGSLRNVSRYGRIVRRALLDEATKKFIAWANREYVYLAQKLPEEQEKLENASAEPPRRLMVVKTEKVALEGSRLNQVRIVTKSPESKRYRTMIALRRASQNYLDKVRTEEQPFRRVWDMVQTARRLHGKAHGSFKFSSSVLHTTSELRATALLFRCDLSLLSDFVGQRRELSSSGVHCELSVNLDRNREDCMAMIEASKAAGDTLRQMEGHFFFASFVAIEQMARSEGMAELKDKALGHVKVAQGIPNPDTIGNFQGILTELEEVTTALREGVFYTKVLSEEWKAIVSAMSREFISTGHWYRCVNGHPFTIGECGRPMESTVCPECGAPVGGQHHATAEGVEQMHDLEARFGVMGMD